jgi:hypothetical protein
MKESDYLPPHRHTCFLETTRKIEGDDDRERLEARLGNVAKVPAKAARDDATRETP